MSANNVSFNFTLGCDKPTPVSTDIIEVNISSANLFGDFAKAFVAEASRVNPLKFSRAKLSEEEITRYVEYIVTQRIKMVNIEKVRFYELKNLYMPSWIQYIISMIGRVDMRDVGLTMIPKMEVESQMEFTEALAISEKIGSFETDLQIVKDAFPRTIDGDRDVMSSALIADYVKALKPVQHVASTYVAAFAGFKLKEEAAFKVLYRVAYDDLNFIRSALISTKSIFH